MLWEKEMFGERRYTVYGLRHPQTKELRYIGKTIENPIGRHTGPNASLPMKRWINTFRPELPILEVLDSDCTKWEAERLERIRISEALIFGANLLNLHNRPDSRRLIGAAVGKTWYFTASSYEEENEYRIQRLRELGMII